MVYQDEEGNLIMYNHEDMGDEDEDDQGDDQMGDSYDMEGGSPGVSNRLLYKGFIPLPSLW